MELNDLELLSKAALREGFILEIEVENIFHKLIQSTTVIRNKVFNYVPPGDDNQKYLGLPEVDVFASNQSSYFFVECKSAPSGAVLNCVEASPYTYKQFSANSKYRELGVTQPHRVNQTIEKFFEVSPNTLPLVVNAQFYAFNKNEKTYKQQGKDGSFYYGVNQLMQAIEAFWSLRLEARLIQHKKMLPIIVTNVPLTLLRYMPDDDVKIMKADWLVYRNNIAFSIQAARAYLGLFPYVFIVNRDKLPAFISNYQDGLEPSQPCVEELYSFNPSELRNEIKEKANNNQK